MINEKNRKWWTLATVCFALLMIVLDGNVVNLALPNIIKDFGASISQIEWVNNAYLLTFAIFLITFGRMGDEIGRKKMFAAGLITFVTGSILCGFAGNVDWLIVFRIIQGLGGAAMMPATLSLIAANFKREERGGAMGLWGAVAGVSIVLGPIIGGYLTEKGLGSGINDLLHVTEYWRYVFFINVPIGILALLATFFIIRESKDQKAGKRYDIRGMIFSAVSVFLLTFGFIEGAKYGWFYEKEVFSLFSINLDMGRISIIPIIFALSLIFGGLFVRCEKSCTKDPLVNLKLFANRNFSVGSITTTILSFAMMGSFFLLPLFLQTVLGFTPIETGRNLIPFAITILIMSPISGKLADKIGGKPLIIIGLFFMALGGYLLAHFRIDTQIKDLIIPFVVMGFGMGLTQAPLTNIALLDTPENEVGGASGILSTTRQIGSVMGIAILGAVLQTTMSSEIKSKIDQNTTIPSNIKSMVVDNIGAGGFSSDSNAVFNQMEAEYLNQAKAAMVVPSNLTVEEKIVFEKKSEQTLLAMTAALQKIGSEIQSTVKQGFTDSINKTFRIASVFPIVGAIASLLFRSKKWIEPKRKKGVA